VQRAHRRRVQVVVVIVADQQKIQQRQPIQPRWGEPLAGAQDALGQHRIDRHRALAEPQQKRGVPEPGKAGIGGRHSYT
jgi:hypothetical protein